MRTGLFAAGLALAGMLAPVADAGATGMNLNYVTLPQPMTIEQCKAYGRNAMQQAGLELLSDTTEAAWAQTNPNVLVSIYCLSEYGIALVAVAGPNTNVTAPVIDNLLPIMTSGGPALAPAPAPAPALGK